jgi:hypothetical protein
VTQRKKTHVVPTEELLASEEVEHEHDDEASETTLAIATTGGATSVQVRACILEASGLSVKDICEELKIDRSTWLRWRRIDAVRALRKQLGAEILQHAREQIVPMLVKAIGVVHEALDEGDPTIALKFLQLIGFKVEL